MAKVVLSGYIYVPVDDLAAVEQALPRHIELTRGEAGCESFTVTQSERDKQRFDVHEVFASETDFANHQQRVQESDWGRVAKAAERHYTIEK